MFKSSLQTSMKFSIVFMLFVVMFLTSAMHVFADSLAENEQPQYITEYVESIIDETGEEWIVTMSGTDDYLFVETIIDENGEKWIVECREVDIKTEQDPRLRVISKVTGVYDYAIRSANTGLESRFTVTVEFGNTAQWYNNECTYIYVNQHTYNGPFAENVRRSGPIGTVEFWEYRDNVSSYIMKLVGYDYQLNSSLNSIVVTRH